MKRFLGILGAGIFLSLLAFGAQAQNVNTFCSSTATPPYIWTPCSGSGGGGGTVNQGTAAAITGGWPVIDGAGTDTTGTLTSGAGTVNASIDGYASIKVQIKGTYAGFTFTTNASSDGGTTFVPIQCALVDGSQFGTSFTLTANQSTELACGHQSGDDTFQIATAAGPASGTANLDFSPAAFPSDDGQTVAIGLIPNGANKALGSTTDAVGATPQTSSAASLISIAKAINNNVASAIPAGANLIGKVGIDQTTDGTTNGVRMTSQYPSGAIPITASATGTTGATTATLAANATLKTYLCSYSIRANANAAATVTNTITGVVTGTLSHTMWIAPAASGLGVDEQIFNPCVPSSAVNTGIAVVSGAPGTGGVVSSTATGYQAP